MILTISETTFIGTWRTELTLLDGESVEAFGRESCDEIDTLDDGLEGESTCGSYTLVRGLEGAKRVLRSIRGS